MPFENLIGLMTSCRHSGQRSRVRKLQYIAELESTVDVLQVISQEIKMRYYGAIATSLKYVLLTLHAKGFFIIQTINDICHQDYLKLCR